MKLSEGTTLVGGGASGSTTATLAKAALDGQRVVINTLEEEEMGTEAVRYFSPFYIQPYLDYVLCPTIMDDFGTPKRNPRLRPIPEHRLSQLSNSQNNKLCPCGSGLKYKKCCK